MTTVATPTESQIEAAKKWLLPRTLMGGTEAMRRQKTNYLPQEPGESDQAYENRLKRTFLFNGFRKTVKDMSGKVFTKPVKLGDDVPAKIKAYAENIDLTGQHINNFAHHVFSCAMQTGIEFLLVDMPKAMEGATRADEQRANIRPYVLMIRAEDVLGFKTRVINGAQTLIQVRIRIVAAKDDPDNEFADQEVDQVKVFDRMDGGVFWRLFEKQKADDGKEEWIEIDFGTMSVTEIPLIPVYLNRTDFFMGECPIEDLAHTNLAHWQSQSDQRNILHVARVPILFASGLGEDDDLQVGAGSYTSSSNPDADLRYVEHTGAAIGAGNDDLNNLVFQMQTLGLELLIPKPGGESATGAAIDQAKMNSPLAMMADNLKDALEAAFGFMAEFMGLGKDAGGSIEVNKDFGISMRDAADLTTLLAAVNARQISQVTFLKELKRRGVLMDDVDPEEEQALIADQPEPLGTIGRDGPPAAA